jgi:ferredoxin
LEPQITNRTRNVRWKHARRIVQISVLAAFVLLTVAAPTWTDGVVPDALFSYLDPLIGLSVVVASRTWTAFAAAGLVTVALTVVLGRVWCGWICPVGTMLDVVPARRVEARSLPAWLRYGKYATLALVLGAAAFGTAMAMVLDPVTIATRPLQELLMPIVGSDAVSASAGRSVGRDAAGGIALLSLVPLAVVLALNAVRRRFWCGSLCPLGGLLAVVSLVPGVRRAVAEDACISCARCSSSCPTAAIDAEDDFASSPTECIVCIGCVDECPSSAISFGFDPARLATPSFDPDRRDLLTAAGATTAGLAVAASLPSAAVAREIVRPPNTDEARLAELCVRCGACYSACPTGVLRPSLAVASEAGLWTPMLDERPIHCTMDCNRCAEVCPTDALHTPAPAEAAALGLGKVAHVDTGRCLAWARGKVCMECQHVCPILGALVETEPDARAVPPRESGVRYPRVDPTLCVACDLCAQRCPVQPAAIGTHLAP